MALLTRSHLWNAAPIPKAEFLALRQSVNELTTMGRKLHQVVRAINHGGKAALPGRAAVDAMVEIAGGLRDHFRALLKTNDLSWRIHGETSD